MYNMAGILQMCNTIQIKLTSKPLNRFMPLALSKKSKLTAHNHFIESVIFIKWIYIAQFSTAAQTQ